MFLVLQAVLLTAGPALADDKTSNFFTPPQTQEPMRPAFFSANQNPVKRTKRNALNQSPDWQQLKWISSLSSPQKKEIEALYQESGLQIKLLSIELNELKKKLAEKRKVSPKAVTAEDQARLEELRKAITAKRESTWELAKAKMSAQQLQEWEMMRNGEYVASPAVPPEGRQ